MTNILFEIISTLVIMTIGYMMGRIIEFMIRSFAEINRREKEGDK